MIHEDLSQYEDGKIIEHPAVVIGHTNASVIYQDEVGDVYYLLARYPLMFEIGTVEDAAVLFPLSAAEGDIKAEIEAFLTEEA